MKQAIIGAGDVKGYEVEDMPDEEWPTKSVPASDDACQPLADMVMFSTGTKPKARIARTFGDKKLTAFNFVALLAQEQADAKKGLDGLRTSLDKCEKFDQAEGAFVGVKTQPDPKLGDESLAYHLIEDNDGEEVPRSFTVVRSGSTLVVFSSMNVTGKGKTETPAAIVEAQMAKLEKVAG
ncbi:hypothetical protein [Streptomyces apocyni]|uniref:hypothetical protein n=1 Tax=Streptomyces apocyni TaxID=2654677 RepID=UPI0012EAA410|nr:hypothetical protein [Streptomyces apocyni]